MYVALWLTALARKWKCLKESEGVEGVFWETLGLKCLRWPCGGFQVVVGCNGFEKYGKLHPASRESHDALQRFVRQELGQTEGEGTKM